MKTITVEATMQNGTGFGVFVQVGNTTLHFTHSGTKTAQASPGSHSATVGGHEPTNSTVTITLKDGDSVIGTQTFVTETFFGYIPYTVQP